jgi:hypothetical protein
MVQFIHMRIRLAAVIPILAIVIGLTIALAAYAAQASAEPSSQAGLAEYQNERFAFALSYPADMAVSETEETDGALTISLST